MFFIFFFFPPRNATSYLRSNRKRWTSRETCLVVCCNIRVSPIHGDEYYKCFQRQRVSCSVHTRAAFGSIVRNETSSLTTKTMRITRRFSTFSSRLYHLTDNRSCRFIALYRSYTRIEGTYTSTFASAVFVCAHTVKRVLCI